jgi:hypothetical protein
MYIGYKDSVARAREIVPDDKLYAEVLEYWSAIPTYEEIRSWLPVPAEIADKIFSYLAAEN